MSTDQEATHPFAVPDDDAEIFKILALAQEAAPTSLNLARGIIDGKLVTMITIAVGNDFAAVDTTREENIPEDGMNLIPLAIIYDVNKYDEDGDDMLPSKILSYADNPELAQQIIDGLGS